MIRSTYVSAIHSLCDVRRLGIGAYPLQLIKVFDFVASNDIEYVGCA